MTRLESDNISKINNATNKASDLIANALSFSSIQNEAIKLNEAESKIPEDIRFKLNLDLIVNHRLSDYNSNLKDNLIINESRNYLSNSDFNKVNASYDNFIFEQYAIPSEFQDDMRMKAKSAVNVVNNTQVTNPSQIDQDEEHSSLLDKLSQLMRDLTEGGSPIGILHLVLDIVGVVGDAFGPVGLIADLLNGLIYLIREKYLLASLSFIGAAIPFAGPVIKNTFKVSKVGVESSKITTAYFSKAGKVASSGKHGASITNDAAALVAASSPATKKAMGFLGKAFDNSLFRGISGILEKFFSGFLGKIAGYIPFIGKPLKKLFTQMGNMFSSFSKKAGSFSNDVLKNVNTNMVKNTDDFFKASSKAGTEIISDGGNLVVKDIKTGKIMSVIPAGSLNAAGAFSKRYGKAMGKNIDDLLARTGKNADYFFTEIAKANKVNFKLAKDAMKIGKSIFKIKTKSILFIGKQISKYINRDADGDLSDSEYSTMGLLGLSELMQKIQGDYQKKNPKNVYNIPIVDEFQDNGAVEAIRKTQNDYAEMAGLPRITEVIYTKKQTRDRFPDDVAKLFGIAYPDKKVNESYILSFSEYNSIS